MLPKHKGDKQHHAALPYQAVPQFVTTLQTMPDMQDAVRLGARVPDPDGDPHERSAARDLAEINLDDKTWTIPGARMKSGREHRVPLSDRAVADPGALQAARGAVRVPGSKPGKPLSNMTFLKAARRLTTTRRSRRTASGVRSATGARNGRTSRGPSAKPRSRMS